MYVADSESDLFYYKYPADSFFIFSNYFNLNCHRYLLYKMKIVQGLIKVLYVYVNFLNKNQTYAIMQFCDFIRA